MSTKIRVVVVGAGKGIGARGAPLSESPVGRSNPAIRCMESWSGKGDLNPRPSPWQGDALPLSYSRSREGYEILILVRVCYPVKKTVCAHVPGCPLEIVRGSYGTAPFGFASFDFAQDRQGRLGPSPTMKWRHSFSLKL